MLYLYTKFHDYRIIIIVMTDFLILLLLSLLLSLREGGTDLIADNKGPQRSTKQEYKYTGWHKLYISELEIFCSLKKSNN